MKVIIAGGTGLIGTELIRQALELPSITSLIVLSRTSITSTHPNASKLKNVIIADYGHYPEEVKASFTDADACVWTVAITPMRSRGQDFEKVKYICQTCPLAGLAAMYEAVLAKPFRFVFLSAEGTPRDLTKKPKFMGDYQLMRGETELLILAYGTSHPGIEVCVAQPGMVSSSITFWRAAQAMLFSFTNVFTRAIPNISRVQLSAAILDQLFRGFEKEPLTNRDLLRLGDAALALEAGRR